VVTGRGHRLQRLQVVLHLLLLRVVVIERVMVMGLQYIDVGRRSLYRCVRRDLRRFPFGKVRQEEPPVVTAMDSLRRRRGRRRRGRGRVIVGAVSGRRRRFPIVHFVQHRWQVVECRVVLQRVAPAQWRPLFEVHPRRDHVSAVRHRHPGGSCCNRANAID